MSLNGLIYIYNKTTFGSGKRGVPNTVSSLHIYSQTQSEVSREVISDDSILLILYKIQLPHNNSYGLQIPQLTYP